MREEADPGARIGGSRPRRVPSVARVLVGASFVWSAMFIVVGLAFDLEMFGDGSLFSYAVAVRDAWVFHWRNISSRLFTYVAVYVPAEAAVATTGNARVGIVVYGALFFAAPLLGLLLTCAIDRSPGGRISTTACVSTACLCPLVFGCPTEMWMAHALFWPTLAVCREAPRNLGGAVAVMAFLPALVFTHEGALVLAAGIPLSLAVRGWRHPSVVRAAAGLAAVMMIWLAVRITLTPDDYIAPVLTSAAFRFVAIGNLASPILLLLLAAIALYAVALVVLSRIGPVPAAAAAVSLVTAALVLYWIRFDHALHADARYTVRTVLLAATPVLGVVAGLLADAGRAGVRLRPIQRAAVILMRSRWSPPVVLGGLVLVSLVHAVETTKFVSVWTSYQAAVRALATGTEADPALGDPHFVSAGRIGAGLSRASWNSTTPYLSVLVAPGFAPTRLVVDPTANYFWLSCETALRSEQTPGAVPAAARHLVRLLACLHRPS